MSRFDLQRCRAQPSEQAFAAREDDNLLLAGTHQNIERARTRESALCAICFSHLHKVVRR
jgi:hypothetical protein